VLSDGSQKPFHGAHLSWPATPQRTLIATSGRLVAPFSSDTLRHGSLPQRFLLRAPRTGCPLRAAGQFRRSGREPNVGCRLTARIPNRNPAIGQNAIEVKRVVVETETHVFYVVDTQGGHAWFGEEPLKK
jgi:hypothetical protein